MVGLISEWFIGLRKYSGWNCFLVIHINDLRPGISYFSQNDEEAMVDFLHFCVKLCNSNFQAPSNGVEHPLLLEKQGLCVIGVNSLGGRSPLTSLSFLCIHSYIFAIIQFRGEIGLFVKTSLRITVVLKSPAFSCVHILFSLQIAKILQTEILTGAFSNSGGHLNIVLVTSCAQYLKLFNIEHYHHVLNSS